MQGYSLIGILSCMIYSGGYVLVLTGYEYSTSNSSVTVRIQNISGSDYSNASISVNCLFMKN